MQPSMAVTAHGTDLEPPNHASFLDADRYPDAGTGTGLLRDPITAAVRRPCDRRPRPARHRARGRARARAGVRAASARSGAAPTAPAPTRSCCASRTRRSRRPRAGSPPGPLVGHCSGATGLDVLAPARGVLAASADDRHGSRAPRFAGAGAAVAGSTARALGARRRARARARDARRRGRRRRPRRLPRRRVVASNFLVTLEAAAERLAASAGVERALLVPLVRATVENWAALGAERALTGPVARGDEATVARQRDGDRGAGAGAARRCSTRWPTATRRARRPGGRRRMRTVRTVAELRAALAAPRRGGASIGLVPTMGALHEGHLSLMRRARGASATSSSCRCSSTRRSSTTARDLARLPARRGARRGARRASSASTILFAPTVEEVYPPGFATTVIGRRGSPSRSRARTAAAATSTASRPSSRSCFNIVAPDVAYFGQKDAQQALVIRRLVRDLDIPVRIEVCPTVREPDGLAMSSRNALLSRGRARAGGRAAPRADAAEQAIAAGERDADRPATARRRAPSWRRRIEPEYLALVAADTLAPVERIDGDVLALVAARVGATRLIDNELIHGAEQREVLNAAHDAEIEDPPGDRDRLRPALRRVDHDRSRAARGGRHPASSSRWPSSTSTTAHGSRPTRSPASAALARSRSTAPRRGSCTAATRSS